MRQHIENRSMGIVLALLLAGCGSSADNQAKPDAFVETSVAVDAFVTVPVVADVVFSTLPDTLALGQVVPVTVTITASPSGIRENCSVAPYSSQLAADDKATTCTGVMTAGLPCIYAFTFTALVPESGDQQTAAIVYDGIICSGDHVNLRQDYVVNLVSGWLPTNDAGATYCASQADGFMDAGTPNISITSLQPMYGVGFALGQVSGAAPYCNSVAVYINVHGGWWTKPFWAWPLTTIRLDGTWAAQIETAGLDAEASQVAAYLVPSDYHVPLARGESSLPPALAAFPSATVNR